MNGSELLFPHPKVHSFSTSALNLQVLALLIDKLHPIRRYFPVNINSSSSSTSKDLVQLADPINDVPAICKSLLL